MADQPQSPHGLSIDQSFERLNVDPQQGLSTEEAQRRAAAEGPNQLTQKPPKTPLELIWEQLAQPLVLILLGAVVLTAAVGEWIDAVVILGVVIVNAVVGFINESKALKAIDALSRALSVTARVLRDGEHHTIDATQIVSGDIVFLAPGDRVPADLRLVKTKSLSIDESALTGESLPVNKRTEVLPESTLLADRRNLAFSSTLVTQGTATGVVFSIGDQTEIGRINQLLAETVELDTPLTRKIKEFSGVLLYIILILAGLGLVAGVLRGQPFVDIFLAVVALSVAAIPEGLPAAMTIVLAIGVKRMAQRKAILRRLPAVETLGSTTFICSDKTGTLTTNRMTVTHLFAGGQTYRIAPETDGVTNVDGNSVGVIDGPLQACLEVGVLCNDAQVSAEETEGDPTEAALLVAADRAGFDRQHLANESPRCDEIPFSSETQLMATLHTHTNGRRLCVKGSLEALLPRCSKQMGITGTLEPVDAATVEQAARQLSEQGLRVLLLAQQCGAEDESSLAALEDVDSLGSLTLVGLQGMIDPPRPEAMTAVQRCQQAGIQVRMVTGDHAGTAAAIATTIGLQGECDASGKLKVLTGSEIGQLEEARLGDALQKTAVCARVAPEQKLKIVQALQARQAVVAMTGDGVNDAPALRQADIGVAMGIEGTEVAKEAADMVLADDNFASIRAAVEEGRGVYDNLIKFITWTLPTNVGEGLVILIAIFANLTLPITPLQILWINMTTAVLLGMMLAFEPREPDIMRRAPRDPRSSILGGVLILRIHIVGLLLLIGAFGLFYYELQQGESVELARTAAVNVFVFGEMFYLWNCRSLERSAWSIGLLSNRMILVGVAAMTVLQLLFTYAPWMQALFKTASLRLSEWVMILGFSAVIYAVVALEKNLRLIRKRQKAEMKS